MIVMILALLSTPEGEFLDRLARRAYARGDFEEALTLFSEVGETSRSPVVYFNMALAAEQAKQAALAYTLFQRYLDQVGPSGTSQQRSFALTRVKALASTLALVDVRSEPEGAKIVVDGLSFQSFETTPATIALSPGSHRIALLQQGFRTHTSTVVAVVGLRRAIDATLRREEGAVEILVPPLESIEVVLRSERGKALVVVPNQRAVVPSGAYRLIVSAFGHLAVDLPVLVPANSVLRRSVVLKPMPPERVRLLVRCRPGPCELWIDDVRRAPTPFALAIDVGPHDVALRKGGDVVWRQRIAIQPGRNRLLDVLLPTRDTSEVE